MALTDTKARLSRQYAYVPFDQADLTFDLGNADVHAVAFKADPSEEPIEDDWLEAIRVNDDQHDLWHPDVGPALAVLVGPTRGDVVDTEDLAAAEYLVWSDVSVPSSDERLVQWHGPLIVVAAPGALS